jgi:hypothetical protein
VRRSHESVGDRAVGERDERRIVVRDVEDAARLAVKSELRPGHHFAELVPGSEAARKHDERVREIGHELFALMHRLDDVKLGESGVADLAIDQMARHHAYRATACLQHRVGGHAHQPDPTAAKDERRAAGRECAAKRGRGSRELGTITRARAAKHAY